VTAVSGLAFYASLIGAADIETAIAVTGIKLEKATTKLTTNATLNPIVFFIPKLSFLLLVQDTFLLLVRPNLKECDLALKLA